MTQALARSLALGLVVLSAAVGCEREVFTEPVVLGGVAVDPAALNVGQRLYTRYCVSCHGADGRADLPTNAALRPAPRDLTSGLYKYKSTLDDALPTDEDLRRTISRGLAGTFMTGFPMLSDAEVDALAQYVKTFSPRWQDEVAGAPIVPGEDPWRHDVAAAIARGERLYHGVGQCYACHPAYVSRSRLLEHAQESARERGEAVPESVPLRSRFGEAEHVPTRYGRVLPPDFLDAIPRAGSSLDGLYRTVAAGVGGTPMRGWYERLESRDLWALAYYVRELSRMRDTPEAAALREHVE